MGELLTLLERSPSIVNVAFTEGRTALYWAVCNGREDAIRLLLKHRADPSLDDKDGDTCAAPPPRPAAAPRRSAARAPCRTRALPSARLAASHTRTRLGWAGRAGRPGRPPLYLEGDLPPLKMCIVH